MRRILHVLRCLDYGGAETWLLNVLRHIDRKRFKMDFTVHAARPGAYDEEVRRLGARIIPCLINHRRPWRFARRFKHILREYGPYDVVHSHVHHYSGFVLRWAHQAGVPMRIAHSRSLLPAGSPTPLRRIYLCLMKRWVARYATAGLAVSGKAAEALYGPDWKQDPRWRVFARAIDLEPFSRNVDRDVVRREQGIPSQALVLGHVGRFVWEKNHEFLIKIAAEVTRRQSDTRLVLVGDGPLRSEIQRKAAGLGLADNVIFTGSRSDVPRLLGTMDVFVFPSLQEGLPGAVLEAQAAGLPCILSDGVTTEADVVGPLVQRVGLDRPASVWADAILASQQTEPPLTRNEALKTMQNSPFNIVTGTRALERCYEGKVN